MSEQPLDTVVDKIVTLRENYLVQLESLDELLFALLYEKEKKDWSGVKMMKRHKYRNMLADVRKRRLERKAHVR